MKLRSLVFAAMLFVGLPVGSSSAYIGISVGFAPPPIPVYVQPPCPVDGYLWTPGYWAYSDIGYYWVPGVWVAPPRVGFLWTPGYWGYNNGSYIFNNGYWGPSVGFYGGINYGFGYGGSGYYGGEWAGDRFRYNTAVTRVNTTVIRNTYVNRSFVNNNVTSNRASFNGPGGIKAQATAQQQALAKVDRVAPTREQQTIEQAASKNPDLQAAKNKGKPKMAAIKTPDQITQEPTAGNAAGSNKSDRNAETVRKGEGAARGTNAQRDAAKAGRNQNDVVKADRNQNDVAKAARDQQSEPRNKKATRREAPADEAIAPRGGKYPAQTASRRPESSARMQTAPRAQGQAGVAQQKKKKKAQPESEKENRR